MFSLNKYCQTALYRSHQLTFSTCVKTVLLNVWIFATMAGKQCLVHCSCISIRIRMDIFSWHRNKRLPSSRATFESPAQSSSRLLTLLHRRNGLEGSLDPLIDAKLSSEAVLGTPMLLPAIPHAYSVNKPNEIIGSPGWTWWNHTLAYHWDLRRRKYKDAIYVPMGKNSHNKSCTFIHC